MDHIAKTSQNQTDPQFKATLGPLAAQPQESRVAGDQETAPVTRTGASFIVKLAVESAIKEKVPPPEAGPSYSKLSQGGAERAIRSYRGAGKTKARRDLEKFFKVGAMAIKDRGSVRTFRDPELDTGHWVATHRPLLRGYLIDTGKFLLGVYENRHDLLTRPCRL